MGVIWEAFWGSRASVKLNFAWAKSQVAIFGVSRVSLFFRIYFQRAPREHFYGFGTRSGFHVGTIVNKFCTFLGYWLRDRKKSISRCTFGRGRRQGVTHRKTFSGPARNLTKILSRPCNPEGVQRICISTGFARAAGPPPPGNVSCFLAARWLAAALKLIMFWDILKPFWRHFGITEHHFGTTGIILGPLGATLGSLSTTLPHVGPTYRF